MSGQGRAGICPGWNFSMEKALKHWNELPRVGWSPHSRRFPRNSWMWQLVWTMLIHPGLDSTILELFPTSVIPKAGSQRNNPLV